MTERGEFGRAAATALIQARSVGRAVEILNASGDSACKLIGAALVAFAAAPASTLPVLWGVICESASSDLTDPYLVAILEVLGREVDWHRVLALPHLPLTDRLGIALQYLPDQECLGTVQAMADEMLRAGDLKGLPLLGLGSRGVEGLLQAYYNRTADVQTCALLASLVVPRAFPSSVADRWVTM
jgi:hypothetical protein